MALDCGLHVSVNIIIADLRLHDPAGGESSLGANLAMAWTRHGHPKDGIYAPYAINLTRNFSLPFGRRTPPERAEVASDRASQ